MKECSNVVAGCGKWRIAPNFEPPPDAARDLQVRDVNFAMLNDRSSAKVGLELDGKQERTDPRMQGQETLPGNGIVTVRAGSTAGFEDWITYRLCPRACGDGGVSRS